MYNDFAFAPTSKYGHEKNLLFFNFLISDQAALRGWLSMQCLCYSDLDSASWFFTCFN